MKKKELTKNSDSKLDTLTFDMLGNLLSGLTKNCLVEITAIAPLDDKLNIYALMI